MEIERAPTLHSRWFLKSSLEWVRWYQRVIPIRNFKTFLEIKGLVWFVAWVSEVGSEDQASASRRVSSTSASVIFPFAIGQ